MPVRLADLALDPPVLLAPMAGITDLPFRRLVAGFGAGLVVSEMVASGELLTARPTARARALCDLGLVEGRTAVQLAGREAAPMAEAARMVADMGARIIDINMGCPARKVTGGLSGSALMRDLGHALKLIEAVIGAVTVPVTLKCRLGWDADCLNAADLARRAEAAGIAMITVHGRTRQQFYSGRADWAAIAAVRRAVTIPVIANGDITDAASAQAALAASGADGVMVGRGARGAPWRLAEIGAAMAGRRMAPAPDGFDLSDVISGHYESMLEFYGKEVGVRIARKHLGWYAAEAGIGPGAAAAALMVADDPRRVLALIAALFAPGALPAPERARRAA